MKTTKIINTSGVLILLAFTINLSILLFNCSSCNKVKADMFCTHVTYIGKCKYIIYDCGHGGIIHAGDCINKIHYNKK